MRQFRVGAAILAIGAIGLAPSAAFGQVAKGDKAEKEEVYPVALLGFQEKGGKELASKVADLLFAKLAAKPEFYLVDRADIKKVLEEQALAISGAVKADEAAKVGQLTGAKLLVTGSVILVDKKLYLVAKLIGTESGRVVGASVQGLTSDDLGDLAGKLADELDTAMTKNREKLVSKPVPTADRIADLKKKLGDAKRPALLSAHRRCARCSIRTGLRRSRSSRRSSSPIRGQPGSSGRRSTRC